jgi:hypothetical protein
MIELLPELEWLVWLDADVLIHNSERRVSDLLDARFAVQVWERVRHMWQHIFFARFA